MNNLIHDGRTFRVETEPDVDAGPPWEDCDGHGVVTEWTTREAEDGYRLLSWDHHSRRYYDFNASLELAKKDRWGLAADKAKGLTPEQITVQAVENDYEYLRAWCNDEWRYVIVTVTLVGTDYSQSLGSVEDSDEAYIAEVARELAKQLTAELPTLIDADIKKLKTLQDELDLHSKEKS